MSRPHDCICWTADDLPPTPPTEETVMADGYYHPRLNDETVVVQERLPHLDNEDGAAWLVWTDYPDAYDYYLRRFRASNEAQINVSRYRFGGM